MPQPNLQHVPSFYHNYIKLVKHDNLNEAFAEHPNNLTTLLQYLSVEKWNYRYAEGKWNIKEMIQHIIDTERIFTYRALTIARKDNVPLPGFDENAYAYHSKGDRRNPDRLLQELKTVQQSALLLFESFDEEQLAAVGVSNGKSIDVNTIGFITIGHALHHKNMLLERYL